MKKNFKKLMLGLTTIAFVSMPVVSAMAASTPGVTFTAQWDITKYFTFRVQTSFSGPVDQTTDTLAAGVVNDTDIFNLGVFDASGHYTPTAGVNYATANPTSTNSGYTYAWQNSIVTSGVSATDDPITVSINSTNVYGTDTYLNFTDGGSVWGYSGGYAGYTDTTPSTVDSSTGIFGESYDVGLTVNPGAAASTSYQDVITVSATN
jgi:hypothetical protein